MDGTSSDQPLVDAIGGSADGSIPQLTFNQPLPFGTAADVQSFVASGPLDIGGGGGVPGFVSSIPWWAWLALGGAIIFKMAHR